MKQRTLFVLSLFATCLALMMASSATTLTYTIPEFSGGTYFDPGPFPSYVVATLTFPTGINYYQDVSLSGQFGNSINSTTAGVDLFFGNSNIGFYLLAQCFEFDPCWTGPGPTPWSADLGPLYAPGGSYYFIASQTSEYTIRLGQTTVTTVVPEPSSLLLLGSGMLGVVGLVRRKFLG